MWRISLFRGNLLKVEVSIPILLDKFISMVQGTPAERVAKRVARFEKLVSAGKLSRAEADRREKESRASILGVSSPVVSGASSGARKQQAVKPTSSKARGSGEVVLPSPEKWAVKTWDRTQVNISLDCWHSDMWEAASHFRNVSLVSSVWRITTPLGTDDKSCRVAFAYSDTAPSGSVTFARVAALKGAVVLRGSVLEGVHTFTPPSGSPRAIRRSGEEVKVDGKVKRLWFVASVERASGFDEDIVAHAIVRYSAGGGAHVVSSTGL